MCGRELDFVQQAFASNWIAPAGPDLEASVHLRGERLPHRLHGRHPGLRGQRARRRAAIDPGVPAA